MHDVASIESVGFLRGGRLDPRQLGELYTGHNARAHLAVEAIRQHVENPQTMRALVFCATVEHARFMADAFEKAGLAAACVTGTTSKADRDQALAGLRNGTVRCICAVDVFNEGVDMPELDTVLFLRPTESAIVFQQQLGRGLRRSPGKRCLTVLDFVSKADHRFRYDIRYRALLGGHAGRASIKRQVEEGFPFLPSGCAITFDRVSRETVLDNLSHGIGSNKRSLIQELRNIGPVDLKTFLRETQLDLEDIYRNRRSFSELKRAAGHPCPLPGPREDDFASGLGRLLHTDDRLRLTPWRDLLARATPSAPAGPRDERLHLMLATTLLGPEASAGSLASLWQHPAILEELSQLLAILDDRLDHAVLPFRLADNVPLSIHAHYRLSEIMSAFGDQRNGKLYIPREGEHFDEETKCNLLFVTLQKDEEDYSPTTMYSDYAIGPTRFHWQSQSGTRPADKKGTRHLEHVAQQVTPLLFVREAKPDARNESMPYAFLGPARLLTSSGERPMNIEWELEHQIPACALRLASVVA